MSLENLLRKSRQLYHDFVRPHEGLDGKTWADAGGIEVKDKNRWLTIIQNASPKNGK